jgi:predicted  nucleic acid-binding Zn ribbon protein
MTPNNALEQAHQIRCPSCARQFAIWTFSLGMSDLVQFPCSNCPVILTFELPYDRRIGERYDELNCACGGEFRRHASLHCPHCNATFSIEQLKEQINWRGTPEGIPGVCITKCIDEQRKEWGQVRKHAG